MKYTVILVVSLGCAPSGPRDVTEHTHDVTGQNGGTQSGYEYVVKKPHGVVAIAESRGVSKEAAKLALERLGASFESCLADFEKKAPLKPGAARIIVPVDDGGLVGEPLVKLSDTTADTKVTTLICLVAPAKMMTFPPPGPTSPEAGTRGMAIEATWP